MSIVQVIGDTGNRCLVGLYLCRVSMLTGMRWRQVRGRPRVFVEHHLLPLCNRWSLRYCQFSAQVCPRAIEAQCPLAEDRGWSALSGLPGVSIAGIAVLVAFAGGVVAGDRGYGLFLW